MSDFQLETHYAQQFGVDVNLVCGVDEAGRGPWAGPVSAAAVILNPDNLPIGIRDSKKLKHQKREQLYDEIIARAHAFSIVMVQSEEIDRINILAATFLAMEKAVNSLDIAPAIALIDGNRVPHLPCPSVAIVKGDALSLSIGAASILAKVTRDRFMIDADRLYPEYGFAKHKGYGVPEHANSLARFGPCPLHRISFKPVALTL